eukprot:gene64594-88366_t
MASSSEITGYPNLKPGSFAPNGNSDRMRSLDFSKSCRTSLRDRPLSSLTVRAAAGNGQRGWLLADGQIIPVALGRGGIKADKREGDGGTPRGTFHPLRLWWRADRHPRPRTFLPVRAIGRADGWPDPRTSRRRDRWPAAGPPGCSGGWADPRADRRCEDPARPPHTQSA